MLTKPKQVKPASLVCDLLAARCWSPARAPRTLHEMLRLRTGLGRLDVTVYFYYGFGERGPAGQANYADWRLRRRIGRAALPNRW